MEVLSLTGGSVADDVRGKLEVWGVVKSLKNICNNVGKICVKMNILLL